MEKDGNDNFLDTAQYQKQHYACARLQVQFVYFSVYLFFHCFFKEEEEEEGGGGGWS
jgi:hypothetical protein